MKNSQYFKEQHCLHFSMNIFTSLNGLKFHLKVSEADSDKFCKFDEIW